MYDRNLVAGILGVALSIGVWLVADTFPFKTASLGERPDFYPKVIAAGLAITSIALVWTKYHHLGGDKKREPKLSQIARIKFCLMVLAMGLYAFSIPRLGYFASTILASLGVSLIAYWSFDWKKFLYMGLNAAGICGLIYLIFKVMFKFNLPQGLLF